MTIFDEYFVGGSQPQPLTGGDIVIAELTAKIIFGLIVVIVALLIFYYLYINYLKTPIMIMSVILTELFNVIQKISKFLDKSGVTSTVFSTFGEIANVI